PTDVLCSFAAPVATQVRLALVWTVRGDPGAQVSVQVDVGNDGRIEFASSAPGANVPLGTFTLGPTPLPVRLTTQTAVTSLTVASNAILQVVPVFGETIQSFRQPCTTDTLFAQSTFSGSMQVSAPSGLTAQFLVIGLQATPRPLPFAAPQPCL